MTPSEIIFLIIAIIVFILVIFLSWFLYTAIKTLRKVNQTIGLIKNQIHDLGQNPKHLIRNVTEISCDVHKMLRCVSPYFRTISYLGEKLEDKVVEKEVGEYDEKDDGQVSDALNMCLLGMKLWKKFKKRG